MFVSTFTSCLWCCLRVKYPPNFLAWVFFTQRGVLWWQPVNLLKIVYVRSHFLCSMLSFAHVVDFHLSATMKLGTWTASLLSEMCCDVGVEPALQPTDHEPLWHPTANREDGARLDVAREFWRRNRQRVFFDVRVLIPFAPRFPLSRCYQIVTWTGEKTNIWWKNSGGGWDQLPLLSSESLPLCWLISGV